MKSISGYLLNRVIKNEETRYSVYSLIWDLFNWKSWIRDPNLRNYKSRILSIKDQYKGNRCFIMGNGPSLNHTPLDLLSDDYVWGLNRCYLLFDRIEWRPDFYVAVDTRVVPDNSFEIMEYLNEQNGTLAFFPIFFRVKHVLSSLPNIYWYRDRPLNDSMPEGHFSSNASLFIRQVRTVTIAALQLAVYLGFNPIYLIGCDTTYYVPKSAKFEDSSKDFIRGTANDDPNHFSPNYFGEGKKYHQPHPERMIYSYKLINQACYNLGVEIKNATVGGALEVFPRIDFNSLF